MEDRCPSGWKSWGGGRRPRARRRHSFMTLTGMGDAQLEPARVLPASSAGGMRNPGGVSLRADDRRGGSAVPLRVRRRGLRHPALRLLARPKPRMSGGELLEAVYAYLQTAGNAYLEAVIVDGEVRGLYCLRPDRVRVVAGRDGWPVGYAIPPAGGRGS